MSAGPVACQTRTVARFEPFAGIRYDLNRSDLAKVIAPPYDVIDGPLRERLAGRDPHNAVRIDLPAEEDGAGRYDIARAVLAEWLDDGTLVVDGRPSFTLYRMATTDDAGVARQTTGVIGALDLSPPGTDILPHEQTTKKAKSDRLELLRACRANLSAIWGLSLAAGLTDLLPVDQPPLADLVDDDGVQHTVWRIDDPGTCAAISAAVGRHPVVVADGHHRYETSLAYKGEREASDGQAGAAGATLAFVVELVEEELAVHAIHRLLSGLPDGTEVAALLAPWFEDSGAPPEGVPLSTAMVEHGCLVLVLPEREILLKPRQDALTGARDLDSSRLDIGLAALPDHQLAFQHGVQNVRAAVASGAAQAGVLLRPATVAQIEATAHGGDRMPPKTTFFHPKPRTGLVFRSLEG